MPAREPDSVLEQFHALYRGEFAFVWAAARRLGVPPGAVDDAVQDVFVTAYRRLDQLRFEVSPRAWLYGVTRRVASRYHRGAFRRRRRVAALEQARDDLHVGDLWHAAQAAWLFGEDDRDHRLGDEVLGASYLYVTDQRSTAVEHQGATHAGSVPEQHRGR